jgi:integrase
MTCWDGTDCYHLVCMIGVHLYRRTSPKSGAILPGYYCSFRVPGPDGKIRQIQRQTGKTNKRDAEEFAATLRSSLLKEIGAGDEKSALIYGTLQEAANLALRGELTPDIGRQFLSKISEIGSGNPLRGYAIGEWLDFWLRNKSVTAKVGTVARYKNAVARFKTHLGVKVSERLESLTSSDVQMFRDKLRAGGRSAKTRNGYLKDIRSCLTLAVKEGLIPRNPASNVFTLVEDDSVERSPFTPEEVARLLSSTPSADWKGMILLGAFGGLRLGDAVSLKAGNIDLAKGCISYIPQKTSRKGKVVIVPLHPSLEEFLLGHPLSDDPTTPLFPKLSKRTVGGRNGLSLTFGRLMDTAGVTREVLKLSTAGAGRTQYSRSFHSLRHSFNSWMANADVNQEVRMRLTGHSTKEVNDIYTHAAFTSLKNAIDSLPRIA